MNCIIIDDEILARTILGELCSKASGLNLIEEFPNAIEAIKFLNHTKVDLIFLDIHMPDFTGFDFIQTLKDPPKIILTTSDKNFAIAAFEYDCIVDYMIKPILEERFLKAIQKVTMALLLQVEEKPQSLTTQNDTENHLYVNIDRRLIKINIPDIYLIEAKGDYISVKTDSKNHIVHSTMKKIEEKLPKELFLKIHRSYIINLRRIIDIEDSSVLIAKDVIPVSRSNKPELMKRLNLL